MTATATPHVDSAVDQTLNPLPQGRTTPGEIPPEIQADIEKFERHLADNLAGELPDDVSDVSYNLELGIGV